MRDLTVTDKNEISVYDTYTGETVKYFFKTIQTEDHLEFNSLTIKTLTESNNIKEVQKMQIDFVLGYITGFQENYFVVNGNPVSSDPKSKNFNPGWKGILKEQVGDHLLSIAEILFGKSNYVLKKNSTLLTSSGNGKAPGIKRKKKNI